MPEKKKYGFSVGMFLFLLLPWAGGLALFAVVGSGMANMIIICIIVIGGGWAVWDITLSDTRRTCHYCEQKIYQYQKRLLISWVEFTEHSQKAVRVQAYMHAVCHKNADVKFKVPVPQYADMQF